MGDREDGKKYVSLFYRFACRTWAVKRRPGVVRPHPFFLFVGEGVSLLHLFPDTRAQRTATSQDNFYVLIFCCSARDLCVLLSFASPSTFALLRRSFPDTDCGLASFCETVNTGWKRE